MPRDTTDDRLERATFQGNRRQLLMAAALAASTPILGRHTAAGQVETTATPDATPVTDDAVPGLQPEPAFVTSPAQGTRTASPHTTISFRGLNPRQLGDILVEGSKSGDHSGVMVQHPDGLGVSWLPDDMFEPGEYVFVTADTPLSNNTDGRLQFRVATPAKRISAPVEDTEVVEIDDRFHSYVSRPDLVAPRISITTQPRETAPGYVFLTPTTPVGNTGRLIADEWGEPVWIGTPAQESYGNFNLEPADYHGQPVIVWWEGAKTIGYGFGHWVIANTAYETIATVQAGNGISGLDVHEILLTPQGTAISIAYNPITWNMTQAGGAFDGNALDNVIQEIDIETGLVLWEWHSLDHIPITDSYEPLPSNDDVPWDYFHLNAISIDNDGHLLISARHSHGVYKIHRATGDVIWALNGARSDFEMGDGTFFAYQHDANRQPDGTISIFDNADNQNNVLGVPESRLIFLRLDEETMTATLDREIIHETGILSVSQGSFQRLPNGNYFVGWGSAPVFSEYDEAGTMLYNARFPQGLQSYRAFKRPWTGRPTTPPDVVVQDSPESGTTVYVSWNGATDVAEWRVMGGTSPDDVRELTLARKARFETAIALDSAPSWIVVEALDEWGRPLGTSEPVAVPGV